MQLKAGFQLLTTSTHLLPSVPSHNNNQPFSNVNLAVNEVQVGGGGGRHNENGGGGGGSNDRVTLYSLYDDGGGDNENGEEDDGSRANRVDAQLPRPSENLKFMTNEYGFLELLDDDSSSDEDSSSVTSSSDSDSDPDNGLNISDCDDEDDDPEKNVTVSCVTCGHYALLREFYDAKHCTYDCSVITRINECKIKKEMEEKILEEEEQKGGKVEGVAKGKVKREREEVVHEEEEQMSPECKRIKLDVVEEEDEEKSNVLIDNPFRVNDLLEAIDPQHQSLFCPVTVVEVIGYRLLLKFVGYSDKYNFWANADSKYIFPVNWSKRYGSSSPTASQLHFHGPPNFSWDSYVASNDCCRVAPDSNFPHINGFLNSPPESKKIRVGMKVEAVDRRNKNLICVATISCVLGDRFLIHFDSWDSLYDYWTFIGSGDVFYCGYCKDHGIDITPPHCYENASEFDWDEYLKKTNSVAMPRDLMEHSVPLPFQVGQQVEVVDKRSPRLLRLATINRLIPQTHTLTVHFPSLKSADFDYDIHAHSENMHPVGWGLSTGHPLADDDYDPDASPSRSPSPDHSNFPSCPNHKLCKSVCNVRGPNFPFHSKVRDCPYSIPNMQEYSESGKFTDRVVVFEDAHYDLGGGGQRGGENGAEIPAPSEDNQPTEKDNTVDKQEEDFKPPLPPPISLNLKACALIHKPPSVGLLSRNSNPINFNNFQVSQAKTNSSVSTSNSSKSSEIPKRSEILTWSHDRISSLVQGLCANLPTAQKVADQFRSNLIDGESFLMLTQSDMTEALGIKLGPAVKIYNLIRLIDLNK